MRKGSAATASTGRTIGRRAMTSARTPTATSPATATAAVSAGRSRSDDSCGECQMSASSSAGARASAAKASAARERVEGATIAPPASTEAAMTPRTSSAWLIATPPRANAQRSR